MCMQWREIVEKAPYKMGFAPSVLRYPYRVSMKNGRLKLIRDPSKGLAKHKQYK
jgi:hypothetical protein